MKAKVVIVLIVINTLLIVSRAYPTEVIHNIYDGIHYEDISVYPDDPEEYDYSRYTCACW